MKVEADGGRVYLPKELRDRLGERFELVDRGDDLLFVPIPDDPLEALREEWDGVEGSVAELKNAANEQAEQDAGK